MLNEIYLTKSELLQLSENPGFIKKIYEILKFCKVKNVNSESEFAEILKEGVAEYLEENNANTIDLSWHILYTKILEDLKFDVLWSHLRNQKYYLDNGMDHFRTPHCFLMEILEFLPENLQRQIFDNLVQDDEKYMLEKKVRTLQKRTRGDQQENVANTQKLNYELEKIESLYLKFYEVNRNAHYKRQLKEKERQEKLAEATAAESKTKIPQMRI